MLEFVAASMLWQLTDDDATESVLVPDRDGVQAANPSAKEPTTGAMYSSG